MNENKIISYFHCRKCIGERPEGISPKDWAKLSVGLTAGGLIQVWCERHDLNVYTIEYKEDSAEARGEYNFMSH